MFTQVKHASRLYCLILFSLLFSLSAFASAENVSEYKGCSVKGKVIDALTAQPVEYATVALFKSGDSTALTGVITANDGSFVVKSLKEGSYYVQIYFIGYDKLRTETFTLSKTAPEFNSGEVKLKPQSRNLNEVTVTAESKKVEYKIDRRVVNVEKDLNSAGGSAATALENTPSVQVDPQGNVTLRGSSDFVVLIDGKPTTLKGNDVLKQIPASSVKQIEVITNPSAKYDADGNAGIINVVMKKGKLSGINGNVNINYGNKNMRDGSLQLNYRHKNLNFFGGTEYNDNTFRNFMEINSKAIINQGLPTQKTLNHSKNGTQFYENYNLNFKGGAELTFAEKNTVSLSGNISNQSYDRGFDSYIRQWENSDPVTYKKSHNYTDVTGLVKGVNFDFTRDFSDNHKLVVAYSYFSWNGDDDNKLNDFFTDQNYNQQSISSKLWNTKHDFNFNYRLNIDYKVPVKNGTFEAGFQYRFEKRFEDFRFFDYDKATDTWSRNNTYSYDLNYDNSIYSGYLIYSGSYKGFGYQAGVRSEFFDRRIVLSKSNTPNDYEKFMFYPSIHFSKSIKDKHQFQLSYSRRINRPAPFLLNDIPQYIDPDNIFMGNPELKPEFTDSFEFNYRTTISKVTISAQSYLRNTTNMFQALRLMTEKGVMIHKLANSDNQLSAGEEFGVDINVTKWLQLSTGANIYYYKLKTVVENEKIIKESASWDARMIANIQFKWGTRLQLLGYYRGASYDAMGKNDGFFISNIAVNQSLLKGKASIGINVRDVFNSFKMNYSTYGSSFDNLYKINVEGPLVMLNLTYNFNNFRQKNRGRSDDTSFKGGGAF